MQRCIELENDLNTESGLYFKILIPFTKFRCKWRSGYSNVKYGNEKPRFTQIVQKVAKQQVKAAVQFAEYLLYAEKREKNLVFFLLRQCLKSVR